MNNDTTTAPARKAEKPVVLAALRAWVSQRPGLEYANYGDTKAYNAEARGIARDKKDALALLAACELSAGVTADDLRDGLRSYSGRLSWEEDGKGGGKLRYCCGQYWPTEYRKAACACLASALWDAARAALPDGTEKPGDALRTGFRRLFGRVIQSRWFD